MTPELTFSDQNKIDLKFSTSNFVWNLCFLDLNTPHIDEKTQKPQYLHVKHQNTRKNTIKMGENTLFSQIDKILKIHSGFVE